MNKVRPRDLDKNRNKVQKKRETERKSRGEKEDNELKELKHWS